MVKSSLNESINYNESKKIDEEDIGYASTTYDTTLLGIPLELAIGKEKYTYSKYDVVYYSLYLVMYEEPIARVAVFEIESNKLINILDEDGDIDLTKGKIIPIVSDTYLKKIMTETSSRMEVKKENEIEIPNIDVIVIDDDNDIEEEEESLFNVSLPKNKISTSVDESNEKLKTGIFTMNPAIKVPELFNEESKEQANQYRKEFVSSPKNKWIVNFMENENYDIIDNEGGGDCFFAVIRDAFNGVGKETTVDKLRALLSKEADESLYEQYRVLYTGFLSELQDKEKELKELKKLSVILKKRNENAKNKSESEEIIKEAKKIVDKHKQVTVEKKDVTELMAEFSFMKDIDSLEKLRDYFKTSKYWADTWAVSTLERLLNIKVLIFSEEAFESGDLDSVLQCGQLNDVDLQQQGQFKPDFYIMAGYNGYHYKLITYREKKIFKYQEIPYDVKMLVINKCMEKNAGPYYLIQDFRKLKTSLGLNANEGEPGDEDDEEYLKADLYDKEIVFVFHSKSDPSPKAGMGNGENIVKDQLIQFNTLNSIKDWRRKLDDSWSAPFSLDGHRWNSIEHYLQGSQFKKGFPDFYLQFSLDSGSDISMDVALAKAAGGKSGKLKERVLRDKKIKVDADFYEVGVNQRSIAERRIAISAKFLQNLDLKKTLVETKHAKLVHFIRGMPAESDELLMKLRREIMSSTSEK